MTRHDFVRDVVADVAAAIFPAAPVVDFTPLRGGLEASVARLTLSDSRQRRRQVVVKRLASGARHEVARYQLLAASGVTPEVFGVVDRGEHTYLFLEQVRPVSSWPWRESANRRLVLEQLARIHCWQDAALTGDDWNYEAELSASAAATVELAVQLARAIPELELHLELRRLRRFVESLEGARCLMNDALGTTLIHGDVHSGNLMLRRRTGRDEVIFLDWGRSRIGSPLEDVSSWLLSVRSWEPAAGRDHDSLFRAYLSAAGHPAALTDTIRNAYWVAAARNVFAGALRYQLVAAHGNKGKKRAVAIDQVRAAFRVIRRADERLQRA